MPSRTAGPHDLAPPLTIMHNLIRPSTWASSHCLTACCSTYHLPLTTYHSHPATHYSLLMIHYFPLKAFDMGLKLCRDGASDVLTAMHIDSGDWQGRPPAALTAMTQYYASECAKASHNHEELDAQFKMVAEQPFNSLRPYTPSPPAHRLSPPLSSPHRAV